MVSGLSMNHAVKCSDYWGNSALKGLVYEGNSYLRLGLRLFDVRLKIAVRV